MDLFTSHAFAQHIEDLMLEWHVPGLSIAVFDSKTVKTQAHGFACVKSETPVTPNTIFDCASISKSLTAAAVGRLIENGDISPKFTWSTPVSQLLPEDFVLPTARATEMTTIEDILCHRSGMPAHDESYLGVNARSPDTPQSVTRNLRNLPMTAEPRTTFQYCNMMYTVASYMVEKISGTTFSDFLQLNIFDVLGMDSTHLQPSAVYTAGLGDRMAKPYVWRSESEQYDELDIVEQPEGQGAGLIKSTVLDYAKWLQAMLTRNKILLSKKTYDELIRPRILTTWGSNDEPLEPFTSYNLYALGWEIEFYRGHKIVLHGGSDLGYRSDMLYLPEHEFGLVIFGNAGGLHEIARILSMELIDSLLDVPFADRVDWVKRSREDAGDDGDDDDVDGDSASLVELRRSLRPEESSPNSATNPPTLRPLSSYLGTYNHPGYHDITIDVKNGDLHIDGSDRGMSFDITFEHVYQDVNFIACIADEEDQRHVKAEFSFEDGHGNDAEAAVAVGITFCEEMGNDLIWFRRV